MNEQNSSADSGIKRLVENLDLLERTFNKSLEYLKRFSYYTVARRNLSFAINICFNFVARKLSDFDNIQDSEFQSLNNLKKARIRSFYKDSLTQTREYLRGEIEAESSAIDIEIVKLFFNILVSFSVYYGTVFLF